MTTIDSSRAGTIITAPFTASQVLRLNAFQESGRYHPYTCAWPHDQEQVRLTATLHGWVCPRRCLYTQDWALASTATYPDFGPMPLAPLESL
jgi:hypothetical protein